MICDIAGFFMSGVLYPLPVRR